MAALQEAANSEFPGLQVRLLDRSADYQRVLLEVAGAKTPPRYYLLSLDTGTIDLLGEAYPKLEGPSFGPRELFTYVSRDAIEIPAFLTLPLGDDLTRLPLIVIAPDDQQLRDDSGFDWLAQFLATRGFAVLQPQFRGYRGYGVGAVSDAMRRSGKRRWGMGVLNGLADGAQDLIERGIADPSRICIVGGGFGGYLALAAAASMPDLYACAVSFNGVANYLDLLRHITNLTGDYSYALAYWKNIAGYQTMADVDRFAPSREIDSIRAPILLLHTMSESDIPFSQAETFARQLREAGRAVRLIELPTSDTDLSTSESRLAFLQALEFFLLEHAPP
jgi:dipeptidyl aminopeptidase/acylaminoacyl peptidase